MSSLIPYLRQAVWQWKMDRRDERAFNAYLAAPAAPLSAEASPMLKLFTMFLTEFLKSDVEEVGMHHTPFDTSFSACFDAGPMPSLLGSHVLGWVVHAA
jgi:hypothetical protein